MNPAPPLGLAEMGRHMLEDLAPVVQPGFLGSDVGQIGVMLLGLAEKWDGAAHHLREENRALRPLLAEMAALSGNPLDLPADSDDIRISALTEINEALRSALIPLHAAIEGIDADEARALNARIWAELRASQARRGTMMDLF
jgi:hypothetical protein